MQQLIKASLLILQLIVVTLAFNENAQPYCYRDVTETSYKVVTKTRLKSVPSKNFFKKIAFKKDTKVEIYEEQEPVYKTKLERYCCDGYKRAAFDMCVPECIQNGCPQNSKCVEPEVCECLKGYYSKRSSTDSKHYCEPICEEPCPENSVCVAPNHCACKNGYHVVESKHCQPHCASGCPYDGLCVAPNVCSCKEGFRSAEGSCLPICSLGDQCQNGRCTGNNFCACYQGFEWNNKTLECESIYMPTLSTPYAETQYVTDASMDIQTVPVTPNYDVDPEEVFEEFVTAVSQKCPKDSIFHNGECRSVKFVSNEYDCWHNPCRFKNSRCLENGTCTCAEGFKRFIAPASSNASSEDCLSPAEYKATLQNFEAEVAKASTITDSMTWTSIFFIVLGILIISSALIYLAFRFFLKQTGEIDVEGKNLACTYEKRAVSDMEKSVI